MRCFAIEEPGSPVPALYATLAAEGSAKEGNFEERKHKAGRGRHRVVPLKPKVGSGTWGKQSSWAWELSKDLSREKKEKKFSARIKTLRCITPMCGQFIKPNDLGEVTRMCRNCIEDQLKLFEMFGKRVKGTAEVSREVKQSKRELSVLSGGGKTLETTPALMLPPSGGVKRANRERRVASVRGSLSVIRQVFTIQIAPNSVCMMAQNQCNFLIVSLTSFACLRF